MRGSFSAPPMLIIATVIINILKCHYDENRIFSIEAILKHKQEACMKRKMLFTIFKHTYIHILFYLVSYTSYIDIVPNKFII